MKKRTGSFLLTVLAAAICFETTSCNRNPATQTAVQQESSNPAQGDPAQANLAPASQHQPPAYAPPQQAYAPPAPAQQQQAPQASYPQAQASYPAEQEASYPVDDDSSEPPVYAEQPPPPIPQYSQPECPGPNYLWTPGTWNYASAGYYWVPGVWVLAPFVGALWTPPYWGFDRNRYAWHHGYWGSHIGFYGGVNYGFGYVGRGYEGGYWNHDRFAYNRTVNNVNINVVKNVYNYRVTNITNVRTSYVGGRGGLNVRPTPAELAVLHERRIAPLPEQVQHIRQAAENRSQFDAVNHGRPETLAAPRPLETAYRTPAAHATEVPGARPLRQAPEAPRPPARAEMTHESRPAPVARTAAPPAHQEQPRSEQQRPAEPRPSEPAPRPQPQQHAEPERRPLPEARPEPQRSVEKPREEQPRPQPRPEQHASPKPEARPEPERSAEKPREEQARPQSRPEQHAAPKPEARPEPKPEARPEARPEPRKREEPKPPVA
jgi:hypothetical protein